MSESVVTEPLPIGGTGRKSGGWYGMMTLIVTEASLFLYLLFSYYYFALWGGGHFVVEPLPKFNLAGPDTAVLLLSSVAVWWGERGARRSSRVQTITGFMLALVLGLAFAGVQLAEWAQKPFGFNQTSYSSLYFTNTGFHLAHVAAGLIILLVLSVWTWLGYFDARRDVPVAVGAIYWHFVDAVWLAVFFTIYVTPYLGVR
jgi:cytochrome c oxidase subunit 3